MDLKLHLNGSKEGAEGCRPGAPSGELAPSRLPGQHHTARVPVSSALFCLLSFRAFPFSLASPLSPAHPSTPGSRRLSWMRACLQPPWPRTKWVSPLHKLLGMGHIPDGLVPSPEEMPKIAEEGLRSLALSEPLPCPRQAHGR